jgi:alkanesulfonate monooxygenase SsuD/methylene tetrahydromethanopterin reductase-like flavin-dependent oxidoreductase (luciferase family)
MTDHEKQIDGPSAGRWPASERPMSLGLMVPISEGAAFGGTPRFSDIVEMAKVAKDVGFEALWFADHFIFGSEAEGYRGVWECWTMMAAAAAAVPDIQIGSLVACTGFRNPGVIAKMAEVIDEVSQGRFILGLGAGWHEPEYDMFGFPFDHRVTRFEEAIEIIYPLLREGRADRQGRYYAAHRAVNLPRGPRPGGPPILVGSTSPRMLGILVRYADAWNTVWHKSAEVIPPKIEQVRRACEDMGRDFSTLVLTAGGNIAMEGYQGARPDPIEGDDDAKAAAIAGFRDLGIRHYVRGLDPCTPASIAQFARVIELLDQSAAVRS